MLDEPGDAIAAKGAREALDEVGAGSEGGEAGFEPAGAHKAVGIGEEDGLAVGVLDAEVAGAVDAGDGVPEEGDAAGATRFKPRREVGGGAVIDDDEAEVESRRAGGEDGVEAGFDAGVILHRDDHGDGAGSHGAVTASMTPTTAARSAEVGRRGSGGAPGRRVAAQAARKSATAATSCGVRRRKGRGTPRRG